MQSKTYWKASDITNAKYLGVFEFKDNNGEWQNFEILELPDRLLFGGACNVGFLESGYILKEEHETETEIMQELHSDLEAYYNDGANFTSRIIFNERM